MTKKTLYTVDSLNLLSENYSIDLTQHTDLDPPFLQEHVDDLFPEGVSRHGNQYFLNGKSDLMLAEPQIELVVEYVRRACYPQYPSRFQSFFAVETIQQAQQFRQNYNAGNGSIWQIEVDTKQIFKADMNLLSIKSSILGTSFAAHEYWKVNMSPAPFMEYLVQLPVIIKTKVIE